MILPDFVLPNRVNQLWNYSGIDSKDNNYPYPITYQYNDRGFRDDPWPANLADKIWCFGDSFTVGIGCPRKHTWPYLLGNTINVSLDGASNYWIAKKAIRVLEEICPETIVIQWSFIWRGENTNTELSDEDRRAHFYDIQLSSEELLENFVRLVDQVDSARQSTRIIHSFIPGWAIGNSVQDEWDKLRGPDWPETPQGVWSPLVEKELVEYKQDKFFKIYVELLNRIEYVPEIVYLDRARDNFHYDLLTAQAFVSSIRKLLDYRSR